MTSAWILMLWRINIKVADTRKCKLQETANVFLVAIFVQSYYYTYKKYNLSNNDQFNQIIIINQLWCIGIRCDNFNYFYIRFMQHSLHLLHQKCSRRKHARNHIANLNGCRGKERLFMDWLKVSYIPKTCWPFCI